MKRLFDYIDRIENITLVWTILGLAFIGSVQVITRYVFNYSFTWFEEMGRYLGVFIAFLGASIGVKTGSHFTMDLIVSHFKHPWKQLTYTITAGLSGLFFFTVTWISWKIVLRMHGFESTSPTMGIPMYIAYLPIPVFSGFIGVRFMIKVASFIRKMAQPHSTPEVI